jgi:hypothetical protein
MEEREEGNTWLTAGGKRAVLSTLRLLRYDAIMQWAAEWRQPCHPSGPLVHCFSSWDMVGLRVERLLTRDLLGTRLDARPTCLLLNLMGGQDGPVCDV